MIAADVVASIVPTGSGALRVHADGYAYLPLGFAPVRYEGDYWIRYQAYLGTRVERVLNDVRCELVAGYLSAADELIDVGIGNGSFIEERVGPTFGYDVNPLAAKWLRVQELWRNPYELLEVESVSMWDVLEHIENPAELLDRVTGFVFLSMPIYPDLELETLTTSRHWRPGEHCWYFTEEGLVRFMDRHGFELLESNDLESSRGGRDAIGSFAFRRV